MMSSEMGFYIFTFIIGGVAGALIFMLVCYIIALFRKPKRRILAFDKYGNPIYKNSSVYFRGEVCSIFWDKELFSFFLVCKDDSTGQVISNIPFNSYTAKDCEVNVV